MNKGDSPITEDTKTAIPFTAKLIAYYRAQEAKREDALLVDELAKLFVNDLDEYTEQHKRVAGTGDYAIVRSAFIENELLAPWCKEREESQIVLLGAGLDTRAYRFEPLGMNRHTVFEIDFPIIHQYKEHVLSGLSPLCDLIRVSADLSQPLWIEHLRKAGFRHSLPTFWILEGVAYYLQRKDAIVLFQQLAEESGENSKLFLDVCVPAISEMRFGPFAPHFEWGIAFADIHGFFLPFGWDVSPTYADDHDHGRDVGQKGMIFGSGKLLDLGDYEESLKPSIFEKHQSPSILARDILPETRSTIKQICNDFQMSATSGLDCFVAYIKRIKSKIEYLVQYFDNPISIGHISPRLLGNPLSILSNGGLRSEEEIEAHIVGYLSAILLLVYLVAKSIEVFQFQKSELYE